MSTFVSMSCKRLVPEFIHLHAVDSTNNYASKLIQSNQAKNGLTIIAGSQTSGRGQRGSTWESELHSNILMSTVLIETIPASKYFYLNMISSLALAKTLEDLKLQCEIKWPNDIIVNDKKISGILIENQLQGANIKSSIIGVGLNVFQKEFDPSFRATSISNETDIEIETAEIIGHYILYLDYFLDKLMNGFYKDIHRWYINLLFGKEQNRRFRAEDEEFEGRITEVAEDGRLLITTSEGIRKFEMKEVEFLWD